MNTQGPVVAGINKLIYTKWMGGVGAFYKKVVQCILYIDRTMFTMEMSYAREREF